MKPLLITSLLSVMAPVASANDFIDFHKKLFKAHVDVHRTVHRTLHPRVEIRTPRRAPRRPVQVCRKVWVPVRYEIVRSRVFVPGRVERVWHPAEYGVRHNRRGRDD